jgi:nitronate monooxygenase
MSGQRIKEAWETGNVDDAPLMGGQSIGLIRDVPSCRELLERMAQEALEHLDRVNKMIYGPGHFR